jgi:two-component system response regulator VicR
MVALPRPGLLWEYSKTFQMLPSCSKVTPFRRLLNWEAAETMEQQVKKIVYVEDELEMIDLVKLILSRKGYEVIGAAGGREGLDTIREVIPDLVLLDLMMPDIEGWDVYQQIRADDATRHIPVIVVTAKAQNIDKVLGLHIAKVNDYISKPFSPQDLVASVERVLAEAPQ